MLTLDVHSATEDERAAVLGVITLAFAADPMVRWAFPDRATYLATMPQLAAAFGGNAFPHGTAHLMAGGMGAALWLPPGVAPDEEKLMAIVTAQTAKDRVGDM